MVWFGKGRWGKADELLKERSEGVFKGIGELYPITHGFLSILTGLKDWSLLYVSKPGWE